MIQHLYPTPVYYDIIKNSQVINYHIDKVIDKVDFKMKDNWGSTHYLSTDFTKGGRCNVIKDFGLYKVKEGIDKHLREYCDELKFGMRQYEVYSWFSKFEKGNYAHIHNHGFADISGAYYYKTNGEDGDFFFESPNPHLGTSKCYGDKWGERRVFKPLKGKIIMFPGWLKHGVTTNMTDNTRISLAFNIIFKDK